MLSNMLAEATGRYRPTPEEISSIKLLPDTFTVSGDGVFATRQGEGITAGENVVFLRLHLCNLHCGMQGGWRCDAFYTEDPTTPEFWKEAKHWNIEETAQKIDTEWAQGHPEKENKRLVISGGEPLIQQDRIIKLKDRLSEWEIEIETNGTQTPSPELSDCQFNCSPKLANSGNSLARRYKPDALKAINAMPKSQFKFVVSAPDDFEEIDKIVRECELDHSKIQIMPEGWTVNEVSDHASMVQEAAQERGYNVIQRYHLIWFGNKRRT